MNIELLFLENKLNFYENKYKEYKEKAESKFIESGNNWSELKETKLFRSAYTKIVELKEQLKQTEFILYIKRHTHHFIKDYTILSEVFLNGFNDWVLRFYKNGKECLFFFFFFEVNIKKIERLLFEKEIKNIEHAYKILKQEN